MIFIVDDNRDITDFLTVLLSDEGRCVHAFNLPKDAIAHLEANQTKPAILITDYNMPTMNGVERHQKIQAHSPAIKTIVISGRNVSSMIGDLHFLQKPFAPDHLIDLVNQLSS